MNPRPASKNLSAIDDQHGDSDSTTAKPPLRHSLLRLGLPLVFLLGAAMLANWLIESKPRARRRRPPERQATLVEVTPVKMEQVQAVVEAMGAVRAAQQVDLHPRVRGEVVSISGNLVPGGVIREGQTVLRIDPSDYRLARQQAKSNVVRAESSLKVEQGNQSIAQKEYELLGNVVTEADRDLVLRKPQLDQAEAALASARAALKQADLDLRRTTIKSPFNAVVRARRVDVGTRVTESTNLATLVGTDAYWIAVSVPVDQLKWVRIPRDDKDEGASARIYDQAAWGPTAFREGRVVRLEAELEEQGRMARLLVEVTDPLALDPGHAAKPRLLIGSYVRVEIDGAEMTSVAAVDRRLLRDGNRVWVMTREGTLGIRQVSIAYRRAQTVYLLAGVQAGESLVVTDLAAPVEGQPLRTERGSATGSPGGKSGPSAAGERGAAKRGAAGRSK